MVTDKELAFAKLLQEACERIKQDLEHFKQEQLALFRADPEAFEESKVDDVLLWYAERDFSFL